MAYRALITDIDGTLTPLSPTAYPSPRVSNAVRDAVARGVIVGLASGRPFSMVSYLVDHLGLTGPSITDNGAVIVAPDGSVLWEATLPVATANAVLTFSTMCPLVRVSTDTGPLENPASLPHGAKIRKVSIHDILHTTADTLIRAIEREHGDVAIVRAASYKGPDFVDVYVSNAEATKRHAVRAYARLLGLSTDDIVGVGDGVNDFPLLSACGVKVAMGNAGDDLKAIADYVAPSVDDDGVAAVIDTYFA